MDLHPDRKPVVSSLWPLAPRDSVVSSRLLGVGLRGGSVDPSA